MLKRCKPVVAQVEIQQSCAGGTQRRGRNWRRRRRRGETYRNRLDSQRRRRSRVARDSVVCGERRVWYWRIEHPASALDRRKKEAAEESNRSARSLGMHRRRDAPSQRRHAHRVDVQTASGAVERAYRPDPAWSGTGAGEDSTPLIASCSLIRRYTVWSDKRPRRALLGPSESYSEAGKGKQNLGAVSAAAWLTAATSQLSTPQHTHSVSLCAAFLDLLRTRPAYARLRCPAGEAA